LSIIYSTGGGGGVPTVRLCVTEEDQAPSSSWTLKEMVWVPSESEEVLKLAVLPKTPLMDDDHS
jgi:hypothetical protein